MAVRAPRVQSGVFSNLNSVGKIASGGMGYVELARLTKGGFERAYAVKRLHPHLLQDQAVRDMFMDEARLAGLVRHPNVVSVLDVLEDHRGPALVMEYIDGISLARVIELGDDGGDLPIVFCLRMALEAARGLHAAHELRDADGRALELVHRDVSPQNILLGRDGIARLTDFGVAKAMNRIAQTSTGILKGKFGYMAPEVLRFEEPDRRADLFALGVVLFESLTRERLYPNSSGLDGARRVLSEPPPDLADYRDDVPISIVALLFRLLAKERDARPATAEEVEHILDDALRELIATEGIVDSADVVRRAMERRSEPELEPSIDLPVGPERSGPWVAWLVAALVLVVAGALWWLVPGAAPPSLDTRVELAPQELSVSEEELAERESSAGAADGVEAEEEARPRRKRPRKAKKKRPGQKDEDQKIPMWEWE